VWAGARARGGPRVVGWGARVGRGLGVALPPRGNEAKNEAKGKAQGGEGKTRHLVAGPGLEQPFGERVQGRITLASPHFLGAELV